MLCNLGAIATIQKKYPQAEMYQREGLVIARQIGQREWMTILLLNLGETAVAQEKYNQAGLYLEESFTLAQVCGRPQITARVLYEQGNLHLQLQKIEEAEAVFGEMQHILPSGDQELVALAQYGHARLAAIRGQISHAWQLGESAAITFERMGSYRAHEMRQWLASLPSS